MAARIERSDDPGMEGGRASSKVASGGRASEPDYPLPNAMGSAYIRYRPPQTASAMA